MLKMLSTAGSSIYFFYTENIAKNVSLINRASYVIYISVIASYLALIFTMSSFIDIAIDEKQSKTNADVISVIESLITSTSLTDYDYIERVLTTIRVSNNVDYLSLNIQNRAIDSGVRTESILEISLPVRLLVEGSLQRDNTASYISGYAIIGSPYSDSYINIIKAQYITYILIICILLIQILKYTFKVYFKKPFMKLVEVAKEINNGITDSRFEVEGDNEFTHLAKILNQSLDNQRNSIDQLIKTNKKLRESEAALYREKEIASVTMHSIGDAVITTDSTHNVDYVNPICESILGRTLHDLLGNPIDEVLKVKTDGDDAQTFLLLDYMIQNKGLPATKATLVRNDDREISILISVSAIAPVAESPYGSIVVFQDVTPSRMLSRQLAYQAAHDELTGLYNRREFEAHIHAALADAKKNDSTHSICMIDLDQFKVVNDTCGHYSGDQMLKDVSNFLLKNIRDTDILARMGGDEMGLLLSYCPVDKAKEVTETLLKKLNNFKFKCKDHSFVIGASIGISVINKDSHLIEDVMTAADHACYSAKEAGRNRIHIYHHDDEELEIRKGQAKWVTRLNNALEYDQFILYIQEITPIDDTIDDFEKYEVLIRLKETDGTITSPGEFIGAAERFSLMTAIDKWVITNTLKSIQDINKLHPDRKIMMSINLSGHSLSDVTFYDFLYKTITEYDVDPQYLCFEVTETVAVSDITRANNFIQSLRQLGCKFSLDDFGSGQSSFMYLKNLTVDYLKIDGAFVKDMHRDDIDRAMVKSINELGHEIGIKTVAEFVENEEIYQLLKTLGVDYAQGFHLSKPRPIVTLIDV